MSTLTAAVFSSPDDEPEVEDINPVHTATLAIYATRGWTRVDKNGQQAVDDTLAKLAVYEYFRENGVVNVDSDIVDDALTSSDLYAKIFPAGTGATSAPVDDVQFEAYKTVQRKLWQWAAPSYKGYCQEAAEMEGLDYVMCEKKVFRSTRDTSTGTGAPTAVPVRFFTSDPDLIFALSSQPASAKLVKAAEETAKHLRMNIARHPELTTRVSKEASSALKQASGHLNTVTSAGKAAAALPAGDDA